MTTRSRNEWLTCPKPNPDARVRLFCIPYAGGGPHIFYDWADGLPASIEVCAVGPPGRGRRIAESPFTSVVPLARALTRSMMSSLDLPFAFFGHSMGALIAYETSRQLGRSIGAFPEHLFVSGCFAPHLPDPHPLHKLPDREFIEEARKLGGMPQQVIENLELMELMLPTLRADFTLAETYQCNASSPLPCPITAFAGDADSLASGADVMAWQSHTTGGFEMHTFPGDHFFLQTSQQDMLGMIARALSPKAEHLAVTG